ncbi:hypothetical protein AVEN_119703-1, partial [Araneus ventricosus]
LRKTCWNLALKLDTINMVFDVYCQYKPAILFSKILINFINK